MSPLIGLVAVAAIWPFGGDKHAINEKDTIKSLEDQTVAVDTFSQIPQSDTKAMESYRLFLDLASGDPLLRAEAMRRLADLQLEVGEAEQLAANLESLEASAFGSAVGLYEKLLEAFPDYEKNDLVLYQLARAYEVTGDTEKALDILDRLVATYPATVHLDEAEFRRGEQLFVYRRYGEAQEAYGKVLQTGPASKFYEQALYKNGWSLFKQMLHEESLDSFFSLLDRKLIPYGSSDRSTVADTDRVIAEMSRAEREMVEDTFRVLSISFSYMAGSESVTDYLSGRGNPPYTYIIYTNLGDLYLEKERYQDGAEAYQAFVDLDPYHVKAPLLQVEVIEAYKQGQFASLVLGGKQNFVERYALTSPYWERHNQEEQPEVLAHLKTNFNDLAKYYHSQAQTSKKPADYARAAQWYRGFLESFPDDEQAPQTNFLLAEVLFESEDYGAAALEYERTAYAYPIHEQSGEAGYAALLAYTKHEEKLGPPDRSSWHRQGIDSGLRFAQTYPEHPQSAAVLTTSAEALFELNEFVEARTVAQQVVERQPAVEVGHARTAWTVIAHSNFDLADFAAAEIAYLQLQAYVGAEDSEHNEVVERIASSIYKQGETARVSGDLETAVGHFGRVAAAAPSSEIRVTADYDAAIALMQLQDWSRATHALEGFRAAHPEHELGDEVTANLAVAYLEAGEGQRAAGEFERIADAPTSSPEEQKEALWQAADLYEQAGNAGAAGATYVRYIDRYPSPLPPAMEARQKLVEMAEARGDYGARVEWLNKIVQADGVAGAERTDRSRYLAAKASLVLAEPSRDAFLGTRLVIPLKASLKVKKTRMEDALAAYGRAADYEVAEVTTAATFQIADLYHHFSKELFDSERPAGLNAGELEQYDILLEEQAYPFEEQAIELHEVNSARTKEGIYDEWIQSSLQKLAELMPVRYAKRELGEDLVVAIH
jgi:tetratricopeptide (TPR) repeat protein